MANAFRATANKNRQRDKKVDRVFYSLIGLAVLKLKKIAGRGVNPEVYGQEENPLFTKRESLS